MRIIACSLLISMTLLGGPAFAQDASAGYARIKPSLVKVWALDATGTPIESGTGFVVASDDRGSVILTAEHVVGHATKVIVNVPGGARDILAQVQSRGPLDTALLHVAERNMPAVAFQPPSERLHEGNTIAAAGFLKDDAMIEISGLAPRLLYPGTISSLPNGGKFIDIANMHVEEGLSGGPVFDPQTGAVIGMVDTRADGDDTRGYAISGPGVLNSFLDGAGVQIAYVDAPPAFVAQEPPAPAPVPQSLEPAEPQPMPEPPQLPELPPMPQFPDAPAMPQYATPQYAVQAPRFNAFGAVLVGRGIGLVLRQTSYGVLVGQLAPFGAARRAGLQRGDVLVAVNGRQISNALQAHRLLAGAPPGMPLDVSFARGGFVQNASLLVPGSPIGWNR